MRVLSNKAHFIFTRTFGTNRTKCYSFETSLISFAIFSMVSAEIYFVIILAPCSFDLFPARFSITYSFSYGMNDVINW